MQEPRTAIFPPRLLASLYAQSYQSASEPQGFRGAASSTAGLEFGSTRVRALLAEGGRTACVGVAWRPRLRCESAGEQEDSPLRVMLGFTSYWLRPHDQNCLVYPSFPRRKRFTPQHPTGRSPGHHVTSQARGTQNDELRGRKLGPWAGSACSELCDLGPIT